MSRLKSWISRIKIGDPACLTSFFFMFICIKLSSSEKITSVSIISEITHVFTLRSKYYTFSETCNFVLFYLGEKHLKTTKFGNNIIVVWKIEKQLTTWRGIILPSIPWPTKRNLSVRLFCHVDKITNILSFRITRYFFKVWVKFYLLTGVTWECRHVFVFTSVKEPLTTSKINANCESLSKFHRKLFRFFLYWI